MQTPKGYEKSVSHFTCLFPAVAAEFIFFLHYNATNSIAIAFINNVNKVTNFPHGPGLELKIT